MILRTLASVVWVSVALFGVHMMFTADSYDLWANDHRSDGTSLGMVVDFGASTLGALGGTDTGRVLTILGSFMIAGTWIPSIKRKRAETLIDNHQYARDEEKILRGELHDDPVYEYRV
ncbi:MAG: hypothetical protein KC996_11925 [Phycisphaerales bacterium]|nr:hypothetical protein [Phycisphaerales bacterium]